MSPSRSIDVPPRAMDRVIAYLDAEFDRPAGSRLPSARQLAKHLKVSTATIHGVFHRLSQEGRIRTKVGSGTYLVKASPSRNVAPWTIVLGVSIEQDAQLGAWMRQIYGGMLKAVVASKRTVTLLPLTESEHWTESEVAKLLTERSKANGLILSSAFPFSAAIRSAYEADGKPVVDLNPPSETTTVNFVAPDYFGASMAIGKAWRRTGRTRPALMLGASLDESVSGRLRLSGLINGLAGRDEAVGCRVIVAAGGLEKDGFEAMERLLSRADPAVAGPDAVYCAGDYLALGALAALRKHGLRVPADVSVIGGSGLDLSASSCPLLTRISQPLEDIGAALVDMLCQRLDHKAQALPGKFLPAPCIGGQTTRPEENVVLGIAGEVRP